MSLQNTALLPLYEPEPLNEFAFKPKLSKRLNQLVEMLTYARPDRSSTEEEFIKRYIDSLPGATKDSFGNRIVRVHGAPEVCWTCHTDTVHGTEGRQSVVVDGNLIRLHPKSEGDCLGADCGSGVWLMRQMILRGKPGLYIFHRGEESGGKGSTYIAENTPELVEDVQIMISLDRRGKNSVITDQCTGVTASDKFALSVCDQLPHYYPDPTGIFTDSAFYSHLIPECTNLSVGYEQCHTERETQDHVFIDDLLDRLLSLNYDMLSVSRQPVPQYGTDDLDWYYPDKSAPYYDSNLVQLVSKYPEATARLLQQWDLTEEDIYDCLPDYK